MAGRAHLDEETKDRMRVLVSREFSDEVIAREIGCHPSTVYRFRKGLTYNGSRKQSRSTRRRNSEWIKKNPMPKSRVRDLAPEILELLLPGNEVQFLRRYFPEIEPHQEEFAEFLMTHNPALLLCGPRHGKSQVASLYLTIYFLCGGGYPASYYENPDAPLRDNQIFLVAKSEEQAKKNFYAIEARLTGHEELIQDFGRFKHADLPWSASRGHLMVDGRQRSSLSGDFSLMVVGAKTKVLGRGGNKIIIDDPADPETCKTAEQVEEVFRWLQLNVFTRLDVENIGDEQYDGVLWMLGARLPFPNDLYTRCEEMVDPSALTGEAEELDEDEIRPTGRVFHALVKDVILEEETKTVLAPKRMSFKAMMLRRSLLGPDFFNVHFRQQRPGSESRFCLPEHVYGGLGSDGVTYPGCLDKDRVWGQTPQIVNELTGQLIPTVRVMSIDPSPTMFAGNLLMDIPERVDYCPHLIDIKRAKMPQTVQMQLIVDWWEQYQYRILVIEDQAAKFLVQSTDWQNFQKFSGVRIIYHRTERNKRDQLYGEQSLAADVAAGRIRIPWGDPDSRAKFLILIKELLEEDVTTTDVRMSCWFPKWNLNGIRAQFGNSSSYTGPGGGRNGALPRRLMAMPAVRR